MHKKHIIITAIMVPVVLAIIAVGVFFILMATGGNGSSYHTDQAWLVKNRNIVEFKGLPEGTMEVLVKLADGEPYNSAKSAAKRESSYSIINITSGESLLAIVEGYSPDSLYDIGAPDGDQVIKNVNVKRYKSDFGTGKIEYALRFNKADSRSKMHYYTLHYTQVVQDGNMIGGFTHDAIIEIINKSI